jgi:uncharacterized membrane protein
MSRSPDELVDAYLRELEQALGDLPRARRHEVVGEVAEHIAEARAELPLETESEVLNLLDRVGDPDDIAAEARERFGVRRRGGTVREVAAIVLLLVGGFAFVIGWFVGVILLWASEAWTTRDKLIGTFVVPFGWLPLFWALTATLVAGETCVQEVDPDTGGVTSEVCTGGSSTASEVTGLVVGLILLVGPIFTTIYLARRMRRPEGPVAHVA